MAGYKETPRQKMIAMMYLVLTALLALNVSKEMLDAFIVVNESVEKTRQNFTNKLENLISDFEKQYTLKPNKVKPYYDNAMQAVEWSDEMIDFIDSLKYALIVSTDARIKTLDSARKAPLKNIRAKDRFTEPTRFFFGSDETVTHDKPSGILKNKINRYRDKMLALIDEDSTSKRLGLRTEGPYYGVDGNEQTWEQHNFYYTIMAADVTILNKLVSEVKNAQFDVLGQLFSDITAEDFKFDKIEAKIIPKRSYIIKGERYEAEVFVAAYDTKQDPEVYVLPGVSKWLDQYESRCQQVEGKEGVAKISFSTSSIGPHNYAGVIKVLNPEGETLSFPFSGDYIVAPPSLTVAATKMNVFYIGVDNPVSISVPGIAEDNIHPRISPGGEIIRERGEDYNYIVRVTSDMSKAVINATADYEEATMDMGSREFRVKRVPDPVAEIAGIKEGRIEKNTLLAAGAIIPAMKDFEFELYFEVQSFTMGTIISGDWIPKRATGNRFTEEIINIIRDSRRGQKFFFENIQAVGPEGITRTLNTINLTIK